MELLFFSICTHLGPIGGAAHRIALPSTVTTDGKPYKVWHEKKGNLSIPDHRAVLAVRAKDICSEQNFEGPGVTPITNAQSGIRAWELSAITLRVEGLPEPLKKSALGCLPRLGVDPLIKLIPLIRDGARPVSVAAYVDVSAGTFALKVEDKGAIHSTLSATPAGSWTLWASTAMELPVRRLELAAEASVTIGNYQRNADHPCSENDYLLHYRLTNQKCVPDEYFAPGVCIEGGGFNPNEFPFPECIESPTLLSCSNSGYP